MNKLVAALEEKIAEKRITHTRDAMGNVWIDSKELYAFLDEASEHRAAERWGD